MSYDATSTHFRTVTGEFVASNVTPQEMRRVSAEPVGGGSVSDEWRRLPPTTIDVHWATLP